MTELELRVRQLEIRVDDHHEALHGDKHTAGLFEKVRKIEGQRLLLWALAANILITIGAPIVRWILG